METVKRNSVKAWLLAARPKTLAGAACPVILGTALAISDNEFKWLPALICLVFAGLMQIAANFINDLFDYLKGTDREDRLGPLRACAQGWISPSAMKKGIAIIVILASLIGCSLIWWGSWELIIVGILCVLFAFFYTTGPYPLSYHGWGDALVIIFFGFIPVGCTYYVQALNWTPAVTVASLLCGIVVDTLLVVNNYRDRDQDAESGKKTIIVRFGEPFGRYLYLALGIIAAALTLYFIPVGGIPTAIVAALYLVLHYQTWRKLCIIHSGKQLNSILGESSRNMLFLAFFLSATICI